MPKKRLNQEEKARILAIHEANVGWRKISKRTGHSITAIFALLQLAEKLPAGTVPLPTPVPGRPRKTTATTDKMIRREMNEKPRMTALELKKAHSDLL